MSNYKHSPVYNLKAVLQETGLKAELLRAWERRYDLPKPQRTAGGHRLYSEHDIAVIKWLHARQEEGFSISSAAELWKEITDAGRDPFSEYPFLPSLEIPLLPAENVQIDNLRNDWSIACKAFNINDAEDAVNRALSMYPMEIVCLELLQRGLHEIGGAWAKGEISVQQEHFATNLARQRIETLIALTPNPTLEHTILLGCPAGELHTFSLLVLNLLLRRKGYNVIYLGASIPMEQLAQTTTLIHPTMVVLAAQQLNTTPGIRSAALLFQKMNMPMAYGGLIFNRLPELRERIPAVFLGENLETASDKIEQLITMPLVFPPIHAVKNDYLKTAEIFQEKLFSIKARVTEQLRNTDMNSECLSEVNVFFSSSLSAALEMGDPAFLEPDLAWVRQLLADRKIPSNHLDQYLDVYSRAIRSEMGETGLPISEWISSYRSRN